MKILQLLRSSHRVISCLLSGSALAAAAMLAPVNAAAELVCRPCPFSCSIVRVRDEDCGDRSRRAGQCCIDLDNRGLDQLADYDHYTSRGSYYGGWDRPSSAPGHHYGSSNWGRNRDRDRDKDRYSYNNRRRDPGAYDDKYGYQPGDCPRGYHLNERECNPDERRRGCRDLRSPSGQICVGW